MGRRANLIEIMDMDDVFEEFMNNSDYFDMGKMGDSMFLSLKNRILEQKVEKLEDEIDTLREKIAILEERK